MRVTITNWKVWLAVVAVGTLALDTGGVHAKPSRNRLASNRLASNRLASNRLASNRLASNALSSSRLEANMATADLLSTADGREVYSYLISCALPEGITIEAQVPGADDTSPPATNYTCTAGNCTFLGALGLAEYWIDHRLAPKEQRWVSACIFARVNANDQAQAISLRGPHDSFTVSGDEALLYSLQEGAFFGNLFTDDATIDWNACRGKAKAEDPNQGGLGNRDCADPDPLHPGLTKCGFKYAGDCGDYSTFGSPYACKTFDAEQGTYSDCHSAPGDGKWPGLKTYREVITTYVPN